ncbi:MAG: response regulator [Candidatus Nephthysia bennettiae]|uniref:Response regulator n=1 Tax=Candidatus Nephthysia bennettiae TaxID=3127016 RepID=A0A934K6B8_9BACT|nr:response regulator [Candidatus Dormibacteraeota bacterium]MBJ7612650.1 response regulator [Candidatus Dormibacteraeota bacterium]PZR86828.1 MAG: response regulator [Candidatus Dormibacteraeota bacterium]
MFPASHTADGPRPLVLVVEDNPVNLELVEAVLEREGYEVVSAVSAEEALKRLDRLRPDLVLLDIQLPGLDGLGLTRLLKANPVTVEIPIVALSAHARLEDRQAALDAGCVDYISKPIDTRSLPGQLAAVLKASGAGF